MLNFHHMMEKFKRFGQMLGLGAVMAAASPEVMAAPAAQKVEVADTSAVSWAKDLVSSCEKDLRIVDNVKSAEDIVWSCKKDFVNQFYFGDAVSYEDMKPKFYTPAEAQVILQQIDRLDGLMKIVDAKYGTEISKTNEGQFSDMRGKTKQSADPAWQRKVRGL
jgi:hypothetical protein